jgi:hypothetical protein
MKVLLARCRNEIETKVDSQHSIVFCERGDLHINGVQFLGRICCLCVLWFSLLPTVEGGEVHFKYYMADMLIGFTL